MNFISDLSIFLSFFLNTFYKFFGFKSKSGFEFLDFNLKLKIL